VTGRPEIRDEPLARAAGEVRDLYPAAATAAPPAPLGNRGGFSGARLWCVTAGSGRFALRSWPPHESAERVRGLHRLMEHARGQGLDFVPEVFPARGGDTVVEVAGWVWELTRWLEGQADYLTHPSPARLGAACAALARLHRAWEPFATPAGPCPAVRRRLEVLAGWHHLVSSGWRPLTSPDPRLAAVRPAAERAWRLLPGRLQEVGRQLRPWADPHRPVQPCLCDLWHDHLLFDGDRLTGLIDYGAVKPDHVAVDLARMLGSLVGDDAQGWEFGLRAYGRVRPLSDDEAELAHVLDRTGTVLGVVNWLRWLYHERRAYDDLAAVAGRLEGLLARVERWPV
jgi:homoserine kinase type II